MSLSAFENIAFFISQCTSAPYLEGGLCKLDNELDNCNFAFFSQETDILMELIMKCVKIKLCNIFDCFHYILNAPRIA